MRSPKRLTTTKSKPSTHNLSTWFYFGVPLALPAMASEHNHKPQTLKHDLFTGMLCGVPLAFPAMVPQNGFLLLPPNLSLSLRTSLRRPASGNPNPSSLSSSLTKVPS